jgi:hypothetical protein
MTNIDEAALRRNTFPNNSTTSITITGSPNLFGPDLATCQRCGKPFEPRQGGGGSPQKFCSAECRKGRIPSVPASEFPASKPATSSTVDTGKDAGPDTGNSDKSSFEWSAEDVCLQPQLMTAIYWNVHADLVIRQLGWPEEDSVVIISRANIPQFLDRLAVICRGCDDGVLSGGA